jgi:hypothetical protein
MSELGPTIAGWLRVNQRPDGRILDPLHREDGTYAAGFASLTFGLMALRTGVSGWMEACRLSINASRQRPRDSEFDQLALLLLASVVNNEAGDDVDPPALALSSPAAETVTLYKGRRLVSNNWIAMRALNYSLRARLTGNKRDGRQASRLWEQVLSWQLPDGLFMDAPGGEATPVTYHAKFCAVLALAVSETGLGNETIRAALHRGLEAMAALVSPSGVLVPYGRSRNTLFGYAAAIFAFRRGACLFRRPVYEQIATRLERRLERFQRSDGHLPCVLNEGEREKADWDVYVNNPDYNAYAGALLLLADRSRQGSRECASLERLPGDSDPVHRTACAQPTVLRPVGPILTVQHRDLFAAFAAQGQAVPVGTPFFCDHRQYGLQPLWIERADTVLFEPVPYRWRGGEDRVPLVDPGVNPWVPYLAIDGLRYCVRRYEHVSLKQVGSVFEMEGEGKPEVYRAIPRWERGLRSLLSRATGHPPAVFRTTGLDGVRLRRRLTWDADCGSMRATTQVVGDLPAEASLHQGALTWSATSSTRCRGLSLVSCK